jgi:hypothetical protein
MQQKSKEKFDIMKRRYEKVKQVLSDPKFEMYFKAYPYNSGYFMCIQLADGLLGEEIRQKLLNEFDTGVICFGDILRIAFSAVAEKDIPELFENIYRACGDLKN